MNPFLYAMAKDRDKLRTTHALVRNLDIPVARALRMSHKLFEMDFQMVSRLAEIVVRRRMRVVSVPVGIGVLLAVPPSEKTPDEGGG